MLPFEFGATAATAGRYINEVADLADEERRKVERENELLASAALRLAADPTKPFVEPEADPPAPHLNFAPLRNAHDRLRRAAEAADRALAEAVRSGDAATQAALDRLVAQSERRLTRSEGLPRRPWFRHHLYAPGMYTGYGVKTLPGVREAIEQRTWDEAQEQIDIAAAVLAAYAEQLKQVAGLRNP